MQILAAFDFSDDEVVNAIASAMSWQTSPEMLTLAMKLQRTQNIHAVDNLSQTAFDGFNGYNGPSYPFKDTFVSSKLPERLPHPAILSKTLHATNSDPERTLYIGSHIDNVITARSFSLHSIECSDPHECFQHALHICRNPHRGSESLAKKQSRRARIRDKSRHHSQRCLPAVLHPRRHR